MQYSCVCVVLIIETLLHYAKTHFKIPLAPIGRNIYHATGL